MRNKLVLAAALFTAAIFGGSAAWANPIYIGYKVGGGPLTLAAFGAGAAKFEGTDGGITFAIGAIGSTYLSEPKLHSTQISIRDHTGPASTAIKIYVSETDLTAAPDLLKFGFASNGLSTGSVLLEAFMHHCSSLVCGSSIGTDIFGTTPSELLYTNPVVQGVGGTASIAFPTLITGPYSQTLVYTINLPRGGISNSNLAVTGMDVPEPLTLSLFGAGLAAMAAVRRRKQMVPVSRT
jgi:hypothetical protein